MSNHSTILDLNRVIYLGHSPKEPLIWPPSELCDGFEPHGLIWSAGLRGALPYGDQRHVGGVYPGCGGWVGTRGVLPPSQPEASLRLIYGNI